MLLLFVLSCFLYVFFLSCCLAQMTLKEFYNIKYTFVKSPQLKRKVEWVQKMKIIA